MPAASPDLTPGEAACSKRKTGRRGRGARTRAALASSSVAALKQITAQDAPGWFWHCGYLAQKPGKGRADAVPA